MMPSMDGWDTCYQIRQISNVPIIMLTARNQKLRYGERPHDGRR